MIITIDRIENYTIYGEDNDAHPRAVPVAAAVLSWRCADCHSTVRYVGDALRCPRCGEATRIMNQAELHRRVSEIHALAAQMDAATRELFLDAALGGAILEPRVWSDDGHPHEGELPDELSLTKWAERKAQRRI